MMIVKAEKKDEEARIALRLPRWLHDDLKESAERSGWDVSKQVRLELAALRGKAVVPSIPQPGQMDQRFNKPTHGSPSKKSRKRGEAA